MTERDTYDFNFPEAIYKKHLKEINGIKFTPREIDIIAFVLNGRSGKRTAAFLLVSPKTVEARTSKIMGKLKCHSREGIIDFVEKSGSLTAFKLYYESLLINAAFEKILKELANSNEKPSCLLVHWPFQEDQSLLISHLRAHLAPAGVKVAEDKRKDWGTLSELFHETRQEAYTFYFLPQVAWEGAHELPKDKSPALKLFVFPINKNLGAVPADFSGFDRLDLSLYRNYYLWVFEILKRLFPKQLYLLERNIKTFQEQFAIFPSSYGPKEKSFRVHEQNSLKFRDFSKLLTVWLRLRKNIYALLALACLGLGYLYYQHYLGEQQQLPIRSELFIPAEAVLLNRPGLIFQIDAKFKEHPERIQTITLTGIGGSGKTTLARQYARLQKVSVAWEINAETPETLLTSFESLAYALSKTEEEKKLVRGFNEIKNQEERGKKLIQFINDKLEAVSSWLLIYDNVDNFSKIRKYFLQAETMKRGKIIVTTRDSTIQVGDTIAHSIPIKELSADEKLDLFLKIIATDTSQNLTPAQKDETKEFLKQLPPFPLDVSTAAYYIKVTNTSYNRYLTHIKKPSDGFNELQESILGDTTDYTKSRYQILNMPLKKLLDTNQGFDNLLLFISLLDASLIPRDLLEELNDDVRIDKLVVSLKKYSLLSSQNPSALPKLTTYSLHRSTQATWLAYLVKALDLPNNQGVFLEPLQAFLRYVERSIETEDFERMKILIPHCETLMNHNKLLRILSSPELEFALGCMNFYLGKYDEAKLILTQNLKGLTNQKKQTDSWSLRALTYLGAISISLGDYETAKIHLSASLKGYKEKLPKSYAGQTQTLRYLATVYRDLGDYKTAKGLFEESLSIYQEHLSENHIGVARAFGYVGDIYRELGDFESAKDYLEQSYEIHKAYFPDNKLGIVWNLAHLGEVYGILGDYEKAKSVLEESLQICKGYLPETHAYHPWISGCLGIAYCQLGRYTEAKEHLTYSASLFNKNFKENKVYYSWALWHLGIVYGELKNFQKAKELLQESFSYVEKEYGRQHIEIGFIAQALARVYFLEGDLDTAKDHANKAIRVFQDHKHAYLYKSFETLADIYLARSLEEQRQGNRKQFESYREKAKQALESALHAAKSHFRENSPFIPKIESKLQELN